MYGYRHWVENTLCTKKTQKKYNSFGYMQLYHLGRSRVYYFTHQLASDRSLDVASDRSLRRTARR